MNSMIVYIVRDGRTRGLEYKRAIPLLELLAGLLTFERAVCGAEIDTETPPLATPHFLYRLQKEAGNINRPAGDLPSARELSIYESADAAGTEIINENNLRLYRRSPIEESPVKNPQSSTPAHGVMHSKMPQPSSASPGLKRSRRIIFVYDFRADLNRFYPTE